MPVISIRVVRKGWRAALTKPLLLIYAFMKNMFPFGQKNIHLLPDNTVSVGMVVPL